MSSWLWVWLVTILLVATAAGVALWLTRKTRRALAERMRRSALHAIHNFRVRLERYKLVRRQIIQQELLEDPAVVSAMEQYARQQGIDLMETRVRVESYIDEILPFFNVLSYYTVGYNIARLLLNLLYRVSVDNRDRESLEAIPRQDVVLYLMNHRSNADYVVVAYVLAHGVSISYAVGEWARVWPLEYVFKSFGAYFVRRRFRDPLYHKVLERYVQLITRNGVTQGIFLEGGLSRDGLLRPAKIGLLDYILRTLEDPGFDRDIWIVPVAINYDRVLEDRSLIMELTGDGRRPGKLRQLQIVSLFLLSNLARLLTGRLKRYGRVAVSFGTPRSARSWVDRNPGVLDLTREERLPQVQRLADHLLGEIAEIVPVTTVPLVSAALLSFENTMIPVDRLKERIWNLRNRLSTAGARLVHSQNTADEIFDRAWRMLKMRRLVVKEGESLVILPHQRPLLQYYANSIAHLLDQSLESPPIMHPAHEPDSDLPQLRPWTPSQRGRQGPS